MWSSLAGGSKGRLTMPLPVEGLSQTSTPEAIKAAISASVKQCIEEGREQKQCLAIAYDIVKRKTGQGSGGPAEQKIRAGTEE